MKRIAYLTPLYFSDESVVGGGERYPLNLAVGVAESGEGFEVELVSYGPRAFRRELHPGVSLRVLPLAHPPRHPLDPVSWDLPDAVADADLVHVMQAFTRASEVAFVAAKVYGKPLCVTDLGGTSSTVGITTGALDLVDRVVCYSEFGAAMLRTSAPVVVIKGGVDARAFRPPERPPPRDRVLFVGRLLPHKGIDLLVRALPPELPLTVCGRPYNPRYLELLKELSAGKQVEFVTDATDTTLRGLYARSWATVLPSQYKDCYGQVYPAPELMGLTLLESMSCGTPVACSRVGAMPEFVRHGETGFVFDTPEDLTAQLRRLAGEPGLADRLGRAARQAVEEEYDLRACGVRLAAVSREVLTGRAAHGRAS